MQLYAIVRKRDEKYRIPTPHGPKWRREPTLSCLFTTEPEATRVLDKIDPKGSMYVASFNLQRNVDVETLLRTAQSKIPKHLQGVNFTVQTCERHGTQYIVGEGCNTCMKEGTN